MISNEIIAQKLEDIANLLEIKGENKFKIRAYHIASSTIQEYSQDIGKIQTTDELEQIKGIGKGLAEKILEISQTGECEYYRNLIKEIPEGLLELMKIEGLGPKRIAMMYHSLGIRDVQSLSAALQDGSILSLAGFGEKTVEKITQGIQHLKERENRYPLYQVIPIANAIVAELSKIDGITHIKPAGSLRRWKETVQDLDILVTGKPNLADRVMTAFTNMVGIAKILQKGETKSCVELTNGLHVDLRFVPSDCFGSSMQYFTGSKEHNVILRTYAREKGFKTSEYGLFHIQGTNEIRIASSEEKELYEKLGMDYIVPELRENTGEIQAALEHRLPHLIEESDIKGDCHLHTNQSDGRCSLIEMVEAAQKLGYEYLAITDHSQSSRIANGLDEERLLRWMDEIRHTQIKYPNIHLLCGIEVDILKDGSLDIRDDVLEQCDIVVASIHSHFHLTSEEMTQRLQKALSHPLVNIFAHPTGRLIMKREPYQYDFSCILEVAIQNHVALEINSQPERIDLKDSLVHRVTSQNGWVAIDSDAHSIYELNNIQLGVHTARRGWCTPQHCINTYTWEKFQAFLKKKALIEER